VVTSTLYGRILVSRGAFRRGDVVFTDPPILLSLSSLSEDEQIFLQSLSVTTSLNLIEDFSFLKSFCLAPEHQRQTVLDCFSPCAVDVKRSYILTGILAVVPLCLMFPWGSGMDPKILEKVVLVKACNAHACFSQGSRSAALYAIGSKMRHSCCPNVVYTSQRTEGIGSFIAKSDIAPGDELFISYVDRTRSTPMRRAVLIENYLFECQCERCTKGIDRYRGINCRCGRGTLFHDQSNRIWTCDSCTLRCSDTDLPVSITEESKIVTSTLNFLESFNVESRTQVSLTLDKLTAQLGPKHTITKLVEKAFLENHLLISYMVVERHLDTIISLTDSILDWCGNDPDFLDSTLVAIACTIGRCGLFTKAQTYLEIVYRDMQFLFGDQTRKNEVMALVIQAMLACKAGEVSAIPDLIGMTSKS
jgi:hypothetical protein